ncbi:MAG TPA: nucleotidyltransferase family protein [Acidimicrobiales bacterium]
MTSAAIVLAAGRASRFGGEDGAKLLAPFRHRPLVRWAVDAAVEAGFDEVLVVTGAADLADVLPAGTVTVPNPRWAEGQATSLAAGLDAAEARGHDVVVVGLGDQPLVTAAAWQAVASAESPIAVATYDGVRRNPVRLAREVWPEVDREGDEGARTLMRRRPELVAEVACAGDPVDVDTREDLNRWS